MGMAAAVLSLLSAAAPANIGMAPLAASGFNETERSFYEEHVRLAARRYGLPVQTVSETAASVGTDLLAGCRIDAPEGCTVLRKAYSVVLVGSIDLSSSGYTGQFALVDTTDGSALAAETVVTNTETRAFLDGCTLATNKLAGRVAHRLGLEVPVDAPLRGVAVYPLVAGGVLIATGTYFLVSASSNSGTLKSPDSSLTEAVSARDAGPRNLTLGITLTSLGIVSTVVGVLFYAPGAERKPLVHLDVDPVRQRLVLAGALP